eukprot:scaffold15589_cov111-Isochrysis_galbana.AAC.1
MHACVRASPLQLHSTVQLAMARPAPAVEEGGGRGLLRPARLAVRVLGSVRGSARGAPTSTTAQQQVHALGGAGRGRHGRGGPPAAADTGCEEGGGGGGCVRKVVVRAQARGAAGGAERRG